MSSIIQGKKILGGAGSLGRSGIITAALTQAQADAAAYRALLLSNGKSLLNADYQQIVSFATQLYAAAGKRVDFLMLRSSQNMGTGSTAYTFHGVNCALVNGPTWGVDGLAVSSSAQRLSGPISMSSAQNYTSLAVTKNTGNTKPYPTLSGAEGAKASLSSPFDGVGAHFDSFSGIRIATSGAFVVGSRVMVTGTVRGSTTQELYINTALAASGTITLDPATFSTYYFGSRENQDYGFDSAIHSLFGIWPVGVTGVQLSNLYNAYKSTIGQGLSLP